MLTCRLLSQVDLCNVSLDSIKRCLQFQFFLLDWLLSKDRLFTGTLLCLLSTFYIFNTLKSILPFYDYFPYIISTLNCLLFVIGKLCTCMFIHHKDCLVLCYIKYEELLFLFVFLFQEMCTCFSKNLLPFNKYFPYIISTLNLFRCLLLENCVHAS